MCWILRYFDGYIRLPQLSLPLGSVVTFNLIFQLRKIKLITCSLPLRLHSSVLMAHSYYASGKEGLQMFIHSHNCQYSSTFISKVYNLKIYGISSFFPRFYNTCEFYHLLQVCTLF